MSDRPGPGGPIETGRVSAWQLTWFLVSIPAIEDSTMVDHWLATRVGIDSWLSVVVALPVVALGVWLLFALADRHPGLDLAGILRKLAGPLAYPLGLAFVTLFIVDAAFSIRQFGTLSRLLGFMNLTPYTAFAVGLAIVAVYGAWLGIEVVARVNAVALLFVDIPLGVILAIVSINHQRIDRMLPILAQGMAPVLWGAWLIIGKFGELVLLLVFLPVVSQGRAGMRRATFWGLLIVTGMALGHTLGPIWTFGASIRDIEWPVYSQVRTISLARFIANLDWLAVVLWTHGYLAEIVAFVYAAALTAAKLFRARSHRPLIPVFGALALTLSYFCGRTQDVVLTRRFMLEVWVFIPMAWGLPAMLLLVSVLRGKGTAHPDLRTSRRQGPVDVPPAGP